MARNEFFLSRRQRDISEGNIYFSAEGSGVGIFLPRSLVTLQDRGFDFNVVVHKNQILKPGQANGRVSREGYADTVLPANGEIYHLRLRLLEDVHCLVGGAVVRNDDFVLLHWIIQIFERR